MNYDDVIIKLVVSDTHVRSYLYFVKVHEF